MAAGAGKGVNGGSMVSAFVNSANLRLGPEPDPSLITFALWRSLLLIHPGPVRLDELCFAPLITPPAAPAIVEHRPNGGLFLAATDEPFQMANPAHVAVGRQIETSLQPLNQIAYPAKLIDLWPRSPKPTPDSRSIVEHRPDGGLFMAATDGRAVTSIVYSSRVQSSTIIELVRRLYRDG